MTHNDLEFAAPSGRAYPKIFHLPAILQLSQKPTRLLSAPCPSF